MSEFRHKAFYPQRQVETARLGEAREGQHSSTGLYIINKQQQLGTAGRERRASDVQSEDSDGGPLSVRQDHDRQLPGGRHGDGGRGVQAHRRCQNPRVRARQCQRQQQEHQGILIVLKR